MKKILRNYMFIALATLSFAACGDDDDYTPGAYEDENRPNCYFLSTEQTDIEETPDAPAECDILLHRSQDKAAEALTVPIVVETNDDDVFDVPENVTFAAGDTTATIHVTYAKADNGVTYNLEITIPDDYISIYKNPSNSKMSYSMSLLRVKWNLVGTGTFTYDFFFSGDDAGLNIYQRDDKPTQMKIENILGGVDFFFAWNRTTNAVTFDTFFAGFEYSNYGSVYVRNAGDSYFDPESNTFYFNNEYIVSAGSFGNNYETFKLDQTIE